MPIIISNVDPLKSSFIELSQSGGGTKKITRKEFNYWKERFKARKTNHQVDDVDLKEDCNIVYFRKNTFETINKAFPDRIVFLFGCDQNGNKKGLKVFLCGMNLACNISTPIFTGHRLLFGKAGEIGSEDKPADRNEIVLTGDGKDEEIDFNKPQDVRNFFRKFQQGFKVRCQKVGSKLDGFEPMNEYDGYAHDLPFLNRYLLQNPAVENIGIHFGVNEEKRYTIMIVGADNEPLPNGRYTDFLPPETLVEEELIADNGTQCCPISA